MQDFHFALIAVVVVYFILFKTKIGYEMRLVGKIYSVCQLWEAFRPRRLL